MMMKLLLIAKEDSIPGIGHFKGIRCDLTSKPQRGTKKKVVEQGHYDLYIF